MSCCRPKMRAVTADYVVDGSFHGDYGMLVDATDGAVAITLPSAEDRRGKPFMVVKTDAGGNAVTVAVNGGELINGAATATLSYQWQAYIFRAKADTGYVIEAIALDLGAFVTLLTTLFGTQFVELAGDTMTGRLTVQPASTTNPAIQINQALGGKGIDINQQTVDAGAAAIDILCDSNQSGNGLDINHQGLGIAAQILGASPGVAAVVAQNPAGFGADLTGVETAARLSGALRLLSTQAEPTDPAASGAVLWLSNGTGAGDAGDLMIKINIGSVVKTGTIVDYSAL